MNSFCHPEFRETRDSRTVAEVSSPESWIDTKGVFSAAPLPDGNLAVQNDDLVDNRLLAYQRNTSAKKGLHHLPKPKDELIYFCSFLDRWSYTLSAWKHKHSSNTSSVEWWTVRTTSRRTPISPRSLADIGELPKCTKKKRKIKRC